MNLLKICPPDFLARSLFSISLTASSRLAEESAFLSLSSSSIRKYSCQPVKEVQSCFLSRQGPHNMQVKARYGLQDGSGFLISSLVHSCLAAGILTRGPVLRGPCDVNGASYPGTSLLYEFTGIRYCRNGPHVSASRL